jgi:hypothetical protein
MFGRESSVTLRPSTLSVVWETILALGIGRYLKINISRVKLSFRFLNSVHHLNFFFVHFWAICMSPWSRSS